MGGNGEFNKYSFCWSNENILEIDRGDGYTTLQIDLMPWIVHFKMGEMGTLRLCIFYAIKKGILGMFNSYYEIISYDSLNISSFIFLNYFVQLVKTHISYFMKVQLINDYITSVVHLS